MGLETERVVSEEAVDGAVAASAVPGCFAATSEDISLVSLEADTTAALPSRVIVAVDMILCLLRDRLVGM
ncbi:hypothetical protein RRF57_010042 [Xylaria bambusicola]|uniref:Uncharacterized protein n=1 Tax=Xylaria bambusicola TaxID=326684 RepID=A0AAN7ZCH0_9PEZI